MNIEQDGLTYLFANLRHWESHRNSKACTKQSGVFVKELTNAVGGVNENDGTVFSFDAF